MSDTEKYHYRGRLFLERLSGEVLVGDGAIGTLLYSRGMSLEVNFEHLNLLQPSVVEQVHVDYARVGAQVLETNTFGANALRLSAVGLQGQVREINRAGVRLARAAAGDDLFVAGAVGPLVRPRGAEAELSALEKYEILREQMEALAEEGIDLFILETFAGLEDLELALKIAHELQCPAVAQMAFLEGGRTRDGVSAEEAAVQLSVAGAAVLGANCGSGPRELLRILPRMGEFSSQPLAVYPNSGLPEYVDGRYMYLATPEYFASRGADLVSAGASLVGGCCGTTPEHIRALAEAIRSKKAPFRPTPSRASVSAEVPETPAPVRRSTFLEQWGQRPVVTVELDPPRGLDCRRILHQAGQLARAGVDAVSLAENPLASIRLGNIALGSRIQQEAGIEVIVHVTCRDRNLIGLHSELMGAHLLGIRNILAVTGDPVSVGGESGATSVFDLNSIGLLDLLSCLNRGENLLKADLGGHTGFLLGAAFNPGLGKMEGQLRKLRRKVDAGARFVQTQPVYSSAVLDKLIESTEPLDIPVLVGILPLVSERNAEFLHNEVPGISLPDEVRSRMKGKSGPEGVREGMAIARDLVEDARGRVGGWYLMPPFGKVELALELMEAIRRKS